MDITVQHLGFVMPAQFWLTAAGGVAVALVICFLRPRRKLGPKSGSALSDDKGTPLQSNLPICNEKTDDTKEMLDKEETGDISSQDCAPCSPEHETNAVSDGGSRDVRGQSTSDQGELGIKGSGRFYAACENSSPNSPVTAGKFTQGKSSGSAVENLAWSGPNPIERASNVVESRDLDDLVDLDSDIRAIEDQLTECKQRIEDLEAEVDRERDGRHKAQEWTVILEKELDAHISARKATDDRCNKLMNKLRQTRRSLKQSQIRCDQLEKAASEQCLTSELTRINDSNLGDSLHSTPIQNRYGVTQNGDGEGVGHIHGLPGSCKELDSDSLEESDSEVGACRRDSLEEPTDANFRSTLLSPSKYNQQSTNSSRFGPVHEDVCVSEHFNSLEVDPTRSFVREYTRDSLDVLDPKEESAEENNINERIVVLGDFNDPSGLDRDFDNISDISSRDEFLDEEEEELYGMDSDSNGPGLIHSREEADFELSRDIMEAIINNVQGDLNDMLEADGDEDSLSDLLPSNLAAMEGEDLTEELTLTQAEISAESIGDTRRTKQFWEQMIASDQPSPGATKVSSGASSSNVSPEMSRAHFQTVKEHWERCYTPDSLHGSDDVIGSDGSEAAGGRSRDVLPNNSSAFTTIRQHWDKVHNGRTVEQREDNNISPAPLQSIGPKIESMKQHWERAMEESPSPRSDSTHSDSLERSTDFSELKQHWDSFNTEDSNDNSVTLCSDPTPVENNNNADKPTLPNFDEIKNQWEQKTSETDAPDDESCQNPTEGAT